MLHSWGASKHTLPSRRRTCLVRTPARRALALPSCDMQTLRPPFPALSRRNLQLDKKQLLCKISNMSVNRNRDPNRNLYVKPLLPTTTEGAWLHALRCQYECMSAGILRHAVSDKYLRVHHAACSCPARHHIYGTAAAVVEGARHLSVTKVPQRARRPHLPGCWH